MFQHVPVPVRFPDDTMSITEFFGRISTGESRVSIGRLTSDAGWSEAPQRPEFDEYTLVLKGALYLTAEDGSVMIVRENEGVLVPRGEQVAYSTPEEPGADYVSICLPAFSPELAHRKNKEY